jgi:hypothetical protein
MIFVEADVADDTAVGDLVATAVQTYGGLVWLGGVMIKAAGRVALWNWQQTAHSGQPDAPWRGNRWKIGAALKIGEKRGTCCKRLRNSGWLAF